jgi:glutathione synthase/RimK-type ligase-like ATP-grasp enzyme
VFGNTPEQDSLVYTNLVTAEAIEQFALVANCPTLLQRRIAKDVDLRVTVVGGECLTVALHSQEREVSVVDCRRDNMAEMRYSRANLPSSLSASLVQLTHSYGLRYAAIDLARAPDGRYWFFEINPAGQWAWLEEQVNVPISEALVRCLNKRA